jgi:hypothetical protein
VSDLRREIGRAEFEGIGILDLGVQFGSVVHKFEVEVVARL